MGDRAAARLRRAGQLFRSRESFCFEGCAHRCVRHFRGNVRLFVERLQLDVRGAAAPVRSVAGSFRRSPGRPHQHDSLERGFLWRGGVHGNRRFLRGAIAFGNRRSAHVSGKFKSHRLLVSETRDGASPRRSSTRWQNFLPRLECRCLAFCFCILAGDGVSRSRDSSAFFILFCSMRSIETRAKTNGSRMRSGNSSRKAARSLRISARAAKGAPLLYLLGQRRVCGLALGFRRTTTLSICC